MTSSTTRATTEPDLDAKVHVYEPHRAGLPPLRPYVRELWQRRHFAAELSRAQMRAANTETFFGQVWLVLNPLLLASVYFVLVNVLTSKPKGLEYFAHLTAGLFVFYFASNSMVQDAQSVTSAGDIHVTVGNPANLVVLLNGKQLSTKLYKFTAHPNGSLSKTTTKS